MNRTLVDSDVHLHDLERDFADVEDQVPLPEDNPGSGVGTAGRRRARTILQLAVLVLPSVFLASAAWVHRNIFVDGYIYLHVVQNILAGNGPVFNAGQRVEAFTSPVWTAILVAVGAATHAPLVWITVVLGIVLTIAGLAVGTMSSARLVRQASPGSFLLPLGAIVFVAVPPLWSLASTGLETGLEFAWIGSCFAILVRWTRMKSKYPSGWALMVLGLGPLIRPELTLDSIVFIVVVLWCDRSDAGWKNRIALVACAVALPLAYQVFRMGYYGELVANTAIAKEASLPRPGRGVMYFADFVAPYWMFIPAIGLLLGAYYPLISAFRRSTGHRRHVAALLALPAAGFLNACYIVLMGGDYIHARLFMAPFFAACLPVAAVPMARRYVVSLLIIPWAIVCSTTLRTSDSAPWSSPVFTTVTGNSSFAPQHPLLGPNGNDPNWYPARGAYVQFADPATITYLDAAPAPGLRVPVIATSWIGYEPYELGTGVQILDLLGLADPLTAHLLLENRGQISGHEKPLPTPWVAALLTAPGSSTSQLDVLQEKRPHVFSAITPTVHGHQLAVDTAWARAALNCPGIVDLIQSPSNPLTFGGFLSNMVHAASRTELRIPPGPEDAYHKFCGPGTPPQVEVVERSP